MPVVNNIKPELDDSEDEDDEGFVFDFGSNQNQKVAQATTSQPVQVEDTNFQKPTINIQQNPKPAGLEDQRYDDEDWDESYNKYDEIALSKTPAVVYQLKNNYFFDEAEILLRDLKDAICANNLTKVKALMQKNDMDINCRLKSNWTPLMYAATCGSFSMTSYFVENGAGINFEDGSFLFLVF
jgi:ankyrin repeat protein